MYKRGFIIFGVVSLTMGNSIIPIESSTVEQLVTAGITTVTALIAWWNNNSFTQAAIQADGVMENLKKQVH